MTLMKKYAGFSPIYICIVVLRNMNPVIRVFNTIVYAYNTHK